MSIITTAPTVRLSVLRNVRFNDCTNGGVTATHADLSLVGWITGNGRWVMPLDNFCERLITANDAPVLLHLKHDHPSGPSVRLIPAVWDEDGAAWAPAAGWHMFGGNYADPGDIRVSDLIQQLLVTRFYGGVAVHDRVEN